MTCIMDKDTRWEWTYLLDVFNNEIIASLAVYKIGRSLPYYNCRNIKRSMPRAKTLTDNPVIEFMNGRIIVRNIVPL